MQEVCEDGSDDGGEWQVKGSSKKGKGRASAPATSAAMSSATSPATPFPVGPLATTPHPRSAAGRTARHHPPMQPSASGTPMAATESGTLQSLSEQPVQDTTATGAPVAASTSATTQPTAVSLPQSAVQDEPETPCLDSLPSTPRAPDRNPDEETPNPFAPVCTDASSLSQDRAATASPPPVGDAAQTTGGSVPMELDIAIGMEQNTMGPVTMPATSAQPAAAADTAQHVSGSAPQPGDGGSNQ